MSLDTAILYVQLYAFGKELNILWLTFFLIVLRIFMFSTFFVFFLNFFYMYGYY